MCTRAQFGFQEQVLMLIAANCPFTADSVLLDFEGGLTAQHLWPTIELLHLYYKDQCRVSNLA